jgi:hypothetical protein
MAWGTIINNNDKKVLVKKKWNCHIKEKTSEVYQFQSSERPRNSMRC